MNPRILIFSALLFTAPRASAVQMGIIDYSKLEIKTIPLRANVTELDLRTPQDRENIVVLSGPDGYLLVDHPEAAANPAIQKALDALGKKPVKFLINTHWHYDHVGGNEIYGPNTIIIAQENVRKRLMTPQKPFWSPTVIGPYPERAWPVITYRDSMTLHFAGEDIELDHYADSHTDTDSIVYFARANIVEMGDVYLGKGQLPENADMDGEAKTLDAVVARINDDTIVISGHGDNSDRRDMAEMSALLDDTLPYVRRQIAAGKTLEQIQAAGLPPKWTGKRAHWGGDAAAADIREFLKTIYISCTNKPKNQ